MLLAHLKWFESGEGARQVILAMPEWLFIFVLAVVGLLLLLAIDYFSVRQNEIISKKLAFLKPIVPTVVAVTIGLTLVIQSLNGYFFAPNIKIGFTMWLVIEFVIGALLVLGAKVKWASIALLTLFAISPIFVGPLSILEHLEIVGSAIFLIIMGSGRWTMDSLLNLGHITIEKYKHLALPILRIATGASLAILAFSEKFYNLRAAEEFLATHHWNLLSAFGVSDHGFVIFAGTVELIFGLALVLNIAPRLVVLLLGGLMATAAAVLGPTEVVGHLFAIGFALAILVYAKPSQLLTGKKR